MDSNSVKKSLTPTRTELKEVFMITSSMTMIMMIMIGAVMFTPTAMATVPSNPILTVSSVTHYIELTWTSSTSSDSGHTTDVFRCEGLACVPDTVQVGNNVNSPYLDATTDPLTDYCYRVEENHGQNTAQSNVICTTTTAQNTPPSITLFGDNPFDINIGDGYSEEGYSAIDLEDGTITGSVIVDTSEFVDAEGNYNIYYDVTDSGGLSDQEIRIVRVCPVGEAPNQGGLCQAFQSAPEVDITTTQDGANSIMVEWLLPITQTNDDFAYFYDVERSDDNGQTWTLIGQQSRNIDAKVIDHTNDYREIYHYLDQDINAGSIYIYKVLAKTGQGQGQGNIKYSTETTPIFIPDDLSGYLIKADGFGIQTTSDPIIQPPLMLGWFSWIMPEAFGYGNPIFTSMFSPTNESFEIQLEPIPIPTYNDDGCEQYLDVAFKRNTDGGQKLVYTVTVFENGVPRHQFSDSVHDTAKRVFNNSYFIDYPDQVITDFTDLSVQIDVQSLAGDSRAFELYAVDFYVPEDNGAC